MSYFLKQTNKKLGIYLQIYDSYYVKGQSNKSKHIKSLGYVDELKAKGISDPISCYKDECKRLNEEVREKKKNSKLELINDDDYFYNYGYFLPKSVMNAINIKKFF